MNFKHLNHEWIVDEKNYLGFVGVNIYECNKNPLNFEIIELIEQGLLINNHFEREIEPESNPTSFYGPIKLCELEKSDFIYCDNLKLEECYNKYWSDKDWGKDLEVFKRHKKNAEDYLKQIGFNSNNHYFLSQEWIPKKKTVELNFFAYFVCIISISENRIAVITYGED